jgi:hypothetical protein
MSEGLKVRELFATLGLEVDEKSFEAGEALIHGLKSGLVATVAGVGAVVAGLFAIGQSTANAANEARKGAIRTGLSTDAYQELAFAAEAAGADVGSLETALFRMSKASYQARQGSAEAAKAFHGLLTLEDLKEGSPDEQFEKLAEGLTKIKDPGERAQKAMAIFGRGIQPLLPLLARGKEGIAQLREEAHELGVVLDAETIANAKEYARNLHEFEAQITGLKYKLGSFVLKGLVQMQRAMHGLNKAVSEFVKTHAGPILAAFRVALIAGVIALGVFAAANFAAVSGVIASWVMMGLASVATAALMVASWIAAAVPFIPLAAAVLIAALALEDLYAFFTGKRSVIGDAIKDIQYLRSEYEDFWALLKDIRAWVGSGLLSVTDSVFGKHEDARVFSPDRRSVNAPGPLASAQQALSANGVFNPGQTLAPSVSVTVQALPGMDEKALADLTARQITEQIEAITRQVKAAIP